MGKLILQERARGNDEQSDRRCMDSLEEKVSVFYVEDFDRETHRSDDEDEDEYYSGDDYGSEKNNNSSCYNQNDLQHPVDRILFWEAQEALLQEILERQSSTGQKLRQEVKRIVEGAREREFCSCCPEPASDGFCARCLRRILVRSLRDKGLDATICTSKWKHTNQIPGGMHEYIEVMGITPGRKKQLPFLIELEFRDQFKVAKACDQYRKLVSQLPEFYIGKPEYLNAIVRILCNAAKRSMKEKKIYMGPWRKRSFMEMKWSRSFEKSKPSDESLNRFSLSSSSRQGYGPCLHLPRPLAVVVT